MERPLDAAELTSPIDTAAMILRLPLIQNCLVPNTRDQVRLKAGAKRGLEAVAGMLLVVLATWRGANPFQKSE
jgi:hypothetical protein